MLNKLWRQQQICHNGTQICTQQLCGSETGCNTERGSRLRERESERKHLWALWLVVVVCCWLFQKNCIIFCTKCVSACKISTHTDTHTGTQTHTHRHTKRHTRTHVSTSCSSNTGNVICIRITHRHTHTLTRTHIDTHASAYMCLHR